MREDEPETLQALISHPSRTLRRDSSSWGTQSSQLWSFPLAPLRLGRLIVNGVAAAGAAVIGFGPDPILLGAIPIEASDDAQVQAAWFFLSAWRYDDAY